MRKYLILTLIIIITIIPITSYAEDNLRITKFITTSKLLESGDLSISEDITFKFSDEFNGVYRNIILDGTDGISDIEIFELESDKEVPYTFNPEAKKGDTNVFSYEKNTNEINLMIFSPSEDEEKTFRLKYTLFNVAVMQSDIGELYYKYLGDENETPIDYFTATLSLPKMEKENIKIFAHGPLNGNIYFQDDDLIKLEVNNVPTGTFIEARVLYPKDYTPLSNNLGSNDLNNILNEEASFIKDLEEKAERRETTKGILNKISIGLLAVGVILSGFIFNRTKRDPKLFDNMNSLYPKDISPAELNLFMTQGINSRGLMATLFDLSRRGYITINELDMDSNICKKNELKKKNYVFARVNITNGNLLEHEEYLLDWLFNDIGDGKNVNTLEIDNSRSKQMMNFNKKQNEWFKLVREQLKSRNYSDPKGKKLGLIIFLSSLPIFILGLITIIFGGLYGIAAMIIGAFLFVYGIVLLGRKSDEGYIQYGLWKDFKKEFENYKDFDISIPKDKTLIYAVALGLSMKHLDDYRRIYGNDYYPMYWGIWYFNSINKKGGSTFEDSFNNSFYGNVGTSNPNSTTFGGGGGFSGGGGGGAGGGGAGGF